MQQCLPPMITPSMPFEEAFDILFVRGGFSAYPSCWDFVKKFESVASEKWIQTMCTCRFMEMVPHPMFGVLLFVPEVRSLKESCLVWKAARECCIAVVDIEVMIKVIRLFCPPEFKDRVLFDGAWHVHDIFAVKTKAEWVVFAASAADGISFTQMWWAQEENLPKEGDSMTVVVRQMAAKERDMLRFKLISNAKKEILDEKTLKAAHVKELKKADPNHHLVPPKAKKAKVDDKPQAIRLTKDELMKAEDIARTNIDKHNHAVSALKKALAKTGVKKFEDDLASIVAGLTASFSRVKWTIKLVLHDHFTELSDWEIERRIHGRCWFDITDDPLTALGYWEIAQ